MRVRWTIWVIGLLAFSGGCQVFNAPDVPATLQAEGAAIVAEATLIAETAQADLERIQATVEAGETQIAEMNSVNQQLLATARALIPPTPARAVGSAPEVADMPMGEMNFGNVVTTEFLNTGVTSSIRNSDGCANSLQNQFTQSVERIYVTTRATQIRAGTVMTVEWTYEGQVVFRDDWTVSRDAVDFCLWYFITPDDVAFSPGRWSVQLFADGRAVPPAVDFVITGS